MRRVRMRAGLSVAVVAAVAWMLAAEIAPPVSAEPAGHTLLDAAWIDAPRPGAQRRALRLTVQPLVSLDAWTLSVNAPVVSDIRGSALDGERRSAARFGSVARQSIRSAMRPLRAGELLTLEFDVACWTDCGGAIEFTLESETAAGRRVLGAVAIIARAPGGVAVRRLGAAEFPATVLPPTRKP